MPTPLLPDPTVAARTALLAQSPVTALVSTRIHFAIPSAPTWPLIVLTLIDDDELRPETLTARIQADVWGAGNTTQDTLDCKLIASTIRSVARDMRGTWGAAQVSNAVAGPIVPSPDDTTGRARQIVDLLLEIN